MLILDRYIIRQLFMPFMYGVLGAMIIISFSPLNRAISFVVSKKFENRIILDWLVHRIPEDMQFIFPVATLMAALLGFARLSREGELTAMRASGISLARLFVPVLVFAVATTVLTYIVTDRVIPPSLVRSQDLWVRYFRNTQPPTFKENFTMKSRGHRLISVGKVNLRDPELTNFLIRDYAPTEGQGIWQMSAPVARWDASEGVWVLENAREEIFTGEKVEVHTFKAFHLVLEEGPAVFQAQDRGHDQMTSPELLERIRDIESRGTGSTATLRVEFYLRSSFPCCIMLFALLGATMGIMNPRSGGFLGFGIALVATFFYYTIMSLSASLGKTGALDPLLSAWLHNIVFFSLVGHRAWKVSNG